MQEFETHLWLRDLESVSQDYKALEMPSWLTEEKGTQILAEMDLFE